MINLKTQIFFLKRMSFLLSSGYSIHQSLKLNGGEKESLKVKNKQLIIDTSNGLSFAESLKRNLVISDNFIIQLISLGEKTGNLSDAVTEAATELEAKRRFQNKIIGSLLYPTLLRKTYLYIIKIETNYLILLQ